MNEVLRVAGRVGMWKAIAQLPGDVRVVGVLDERRHVSRSPRTQRTQSAGKLHQNSAGPLARSHRSASRKHGQAASTRRQNFRE